MSLIFLSSNLGTSTPLSLIEFESGTCCQNRNSANGLGFWFGSSTFQKRPLKLDDGCGKNRICFFDRYEYDNIWLIFNF
jgi:hypothetical protein